jgi:hypothetical protein
MYTHLDRAQRYLDDLYPGELTITETTGWWEKGKGGQKYLVTDTYRPGQCYYGRTPMKAVEAARNGAKQPDISHDARYDKGGEAEQRYEAWKMARAGR